MASGDVEEILESRKKGKTTEYLVRWAPTWEAERNLSCAKLLKEFKQKSGDSDEKEENGDQNEDKDDDEEADEAEEANASKRATPRKAAKAGAKKRKASAGAKGRKRRR